MKDLVKALQIFLKYEESNNDMSMENDIFRVYVTPTKVNDEDRKTLIKLGFEEDIENKLFRRFF